MDDIGQASEDAAKEKMGAQLKLLNDALNMTEGVSPLSKTS
jgi:hypothetical protein